MPVDKFGRRDYRPTQTLVNETTAVVSLSEMNDKFLKRDGTNTAVGKINMIGNTFTDVSSAENDHDAATKFTLTTMRESRKQVVRCWVI